MSSSNPLDQVIVYVGPTPPPAITAKPLSSFPWTQIEPHVLGAVCDVAPNGDVYVAWMLANADGTGAIKVRKSTNGGSTFGSVILNRSMTVTFPFQIGRIDIRNFPSLAIDPNTGYVYIAYTHKETSGDLNVYYTFSTNGGTSWSASTVGTETTSGHQFFPALSVDPTGKVMLGYYDYRNNPNVDVYLAESFNNGTSFGYHTKITSGYTTNNPANSTFSHHYFSVASTVGFVYPLWTDYRNLNADIYNSRVNRRPTSNTVNATAGNGERKLARDANGTYHQVFESNQDIWYARKTSTDGEWNNYQRLNSGTVTSNSSPCIAERGGKIYIVWQKLNGSSYDVYFHKSTDGGSTWPDANRQTRATSVGSNPSLPVITSPATDKLTLVYRTASNLTSQVSTNDGGAWSSYVVPSTGTSDSSPSLTTNTTYFGGGSRSCLAYARTPGTIYYNYYINGPDSTTGWRPNAINLSAIVSGTYTGHKKPSLAPKGNSSAGLHVAWEANTGPYGVIIHRKATDWYTWPNVYSVTYYELQSQPSITGLTGDTADLLFQCYGQTCLYKMYYNGSSWGVPVSVGSGANPSVSAGNTTAKYVWTGAAAAAPYQINLSSETLSKTDAGPLAVAYHRSIAVLDPDTNAWLEVRLDKMSVKTKTGEELSIPLVNPKEDSLTLTPPNAFANLASQAVVLPADADSLSITCLVSGQGLSAVKNSANPIGVDIVLTAKRGATIKLPVINSAAQNLTTKRLLLTTSIAAFAGAEVSLNTQVIGIATNKTSLIASLGHIYEVIGTPLPKGVEVVAQKATPQVFALTAYPNPFNPSTQIRFAMQDEGLAALRVYNLNGQLVRELLYERCAAGEHTTPWDGRDDRGALATSGVYFIRLEAGDQIKLSKVTLVR